MLHNIRDLREYKNVTVRILIENPYAQFSGYLIPLVTQLDKQYHLHIAYDDNVIYENNQVARTIGFFATDMNNYEVPDYVIKAIRKKRHLFRTEYILDIRYTIDGSFIFGRFD